MTLKLLAASALIFLSVCTAHDVRAQAAPSGGSAAPSSAQAAADSGAALAPVITNNAPTAMQGNEAAKDSSATDAQPADFGAGTLRRTSAPNEFQRFVAATTGQSLRTFGESYFSGGAQTYAPVERIPVPADYVLGPGDELYIRGWGTIDIDYRTTIDRNGQISLPKIGTFAVAGLRANEIEGQLRTQISRVFKGFSLNVTLGQLRSIQIFVVGQAQQPGTYTVSSLSTLVNAVFASGGPGANGSMRRVQLKRNNTVVTELDLYEFVVQGNKSKDVRLLPGDVIVYLPAGPRVAVLGAVDSSAIYELKPAGGSLSEILSLAGGSRAHANLTTAQLERIDSGNAKSPRQVQSIDLATAAQTLLRDGDVLTVFAVGPQFANAVTLRGNVAAPLRYPFIQGMRISSLIPERDALITPDYHQRKNRLVQFTETRRIGGAALVSEVRNLVDEPNWEYATVERLDADRINTRLLTFNLGKAVIAKDPEHDLLLLPGDVVTIFSSKEIRGPEARGSRLVRVEGEVDRPGIYQLQPGESLRAILARAGGVTPQAYLFGTEFSRERTRQKQRQALDQALRRLEASSAGDMATQAASLSASSDAATAARLQAAQAEARKAQLARLRSLQPNGRIALELSPGIKAADQLPDLPLEDGDAILIPSRPGFVFAVGAVANDNALIWRAGRSVNDYLEVAGVMPEADESNIFVARADGSVIHSRSSSGHLFGKSFGSRILLPGDTIVVPDQLNRETAWNAFVRGTKDWTQILANFGLAAAAIHTLNN
jgi:protein involved in polysaccharide export with SLBB domain